MINRALSMFSLHDRLGRWPYALLTPAVFFSQHLVAVALYAAYGRTPAMGPAFIFTPLRFIAQINEAPGALMLAAFAGMLAVAWLLAALSFRRAATTGHDPWVAAAILVPGFQVLAYAVLAFAPAPKRAGHPDAPAPSAPAAWLLASEGMLIGVTLTLGVVAVGALVFRTYGFGIFVLSPFVVGLTTGYVANRRRDIGQGTTTWIVMGALLLGGLALIAAALEGLICLIMAAPLAMLVAYAGGLLGRAGARLRGRRAGQTLMSVTLLPLTFVVEVAMPASVSFEDRKSVVITAPPEAVWAALIGMDRIEGRPALPFRLGVAYPKGAAIEGTGVGALRIGEFSTGRAVERVTEWVPGRKLTFDVLSSPPSMKELSPYDHVHAPHVVGYFDTSWTSFEITPLPGGRSRLELRSEHELKLDPVLYWLPIARLVVAGGHQRVLEHVRRQAEAG